MELMPIEDIKDEKGRKVDRFYLCDRKACKECSYGCKHTPDIRHAVNFEKTSSGQYIEKEQPKIEERTNEILYVCDRKACENCNPFCYYTADIEHAVEFRKTDSGDYVQKHPLIDHCEIHNGDISTSKNELTKGDWENLENKIANQLAMLNKTIELGFDNLMNYMIFLERL